MDGSVLQTWMSDILHVITQGLLVPDIVLLIAFIAYALFCIGSILVEFFTERRHFKVTMPKFLAALMSAKESEIPTVIENSGLLKRQKIALLTVYDYRVLPGDALMALIRRLVSEEESRYDRISGRNNMAARVSPMLGLMGTLIPLGPGIQALGTANTELLSASLLIAFDTTVAGLVVAAVCMVIGKIRSIWYGNYMSALDSGMATMLQKIEDMRAEGKIVTKEPTDYAFLFSKSVRDGKAAGKANKIAKANEAGKASADAAAPSFAPVFTGASTNFGTPAFQPPRSDAAPSVDAAPVQDNIPSRDAEPVKDTAPRGSALDEIARLVADSAAEQLAASPSGAGAMPEPAPVADASATTGPIPSLASNAAVDSTAATASAVAQRPLTPLQASASFAPVPDPAFISDLHAAAVMNPAPDVNTASVAEPVAEDASFAEDAGPVAEATSLAEDAEPVDDAASEAPAFATNPIPPIAQEDDAASSTQFPRPAKSWYQPSLHAENKND